MSVFFDFPLPSPFEEFNINTQTNHSQWTFVLREPADNQISESASQLKCGFWDVREAVVDNESRLEFQKVTGYH